MIIRVNSRRMFTVLMTAYLMNVFYFNMYESVQKLFLWSLVAVYLVLNTKTVSKIINRKVLRYLKKKNVF